MHPSHCVCVVHFTRDASGNAVYSLSDVAGARGVKPAMQSKCETYISPTKGSVVTLKQATTEKTYGANVLKIKNVKRRLLCDTFVLFVCECMWKLAKPSAGSIGDSWWFERQKRRCGYSLIEFKRSDKGWLIYINSLYFKVE